MCAIGSGAGTGIGSAIGIGLATGIGSATGIAVATLTPRQTDVRTRRDLGWKSIMMVMLQIS